MKQIDFLPQRYRDQDAQRQAVVWRLMLLAMFGGAVAAAAVAQLAYRASVRATLDQVRPMYAAAQAKSQLLTQRQIELDDAAAAATLCALLESPWPRTQILAAVLDPLPAAIKIEELHLAQQEKPSEATHGTETDGPLLGQAETGGTSGQLAAAPAKRDLLALRTELAARQTALHLTGTTEDVKHLNEYLEVLQASALIVRVELLSLEQDAASPTMARLRFTAQITIRPSLAQAPSPSPNRPTSQIAAGQSGDESRSSQTPSDAG